MTGWLCLLPKLLLKVDLNTGSKQIPETPPQKKVVASQPFNRFQGEEDAKLGGWCISQSNETDIDITRSQCDSHILYLLREGEQHLRIRFFKSLISKPRFLQFVLTTAGGKKCFLL